MGLTKILQPSVSLTLANADREVANTAQKVLIVGQKNGGTATSGALVENISSSGAPENALFGEDSMVSAMIRAFKKVNKVVQVDVISLDDSGTTDRVVDTVFAGAATAAGTITVVVGSEIDHTFTVAIPDTTANTAIPALLVTAINADTKVPFTAADGTLGRLELTAVNAGTVANDLGIEIIVDVAGITIGTPMVETTAGATDPTLTNVLDAATGRYQGIVWPYADQTEPARFLGLRTNVVNNVLDGVAITTIQDTTSALAATTLNALNDQNLVLFVDKQEAEITSTTENYLGPSQNEASYVKSALFAGIRALRLTSGQIITQFLTSGASLDQFGGTALASLPYFNTPQGGPRLDGPGDRGNLHRGRLGDG
jgi:phage tail sheath gpL-like